MDHAYRRGELLRHIVFTSKIDNINFTAAKAPDLPKRHFGHAHGALGFALHDPVREELRALAHAPLVRLEVAIDARPRKAVLPKLRADHGLWDAFMNQTYVLLAENLYPWRGAGIPAGDVWSFSKDGGSHPRSWSRPTSRDSLYFGHRGDPAQLKLYWKVRDQDQPLEREQQSVRVELTLNGEGCRLTALERVGQLLEFGFRDRLQPYFHTIRPRLIPGLFRRAPGRLGEHLRERALRDLHETVQGAGAHALQEHAWATKNKVASFEALNRKMRSALDDIIRVRR
jgi:hypothetical protein